jgi:transposase
MWAYSQDLRERIVKAVRDEGVSKTEVARRFSVSRQSVHSYLKLAAGAGLEPKRPKGRERKLSPALEQAVLARAERQDTTLQSFATGFKRSMEWRSTGATYGGY